MLRTQDTACAWRCPRTLDVNRRRPGMRAEREGRMQGEGRVIDATAGGDLADVDLCVIGGGINGVGIARDAAGRGLSVALCEKGDLGEGTSSRSSKLIHGGLRYLEHLEFRLVHEALIEREVLLEAAPHVIRPMRFVMPQGSGDRPRWLVRLGLLLYDTLGKRRRHRCPILRRAAALRRRSGESERGDARHERCRQRKSPTPGGNSVRYSAQRAGDGSVARAHARARFVLRPDGPGRTKIGEGDAVRRGRPRSRGARTRHDARTQNRAAPWSLSRTASRPRREEPSRP